MKYKLVDDFDKFFFHDSTLSKITLDEGVMTWEIEGLVARYNNPCNETLMDRYLGTTYVRLINPSIEKFFLEGHKLYDMDDKLIEEVPNKDVAVVEYPGALKDLSDAVIFTCLPDYRMGADRKYVELALDVNEDDTYWVCVEFDKAVFEWDEFHNRATIEGL